MLNITALPVGAIGTNCYLVWDEATRKTLIFDPGADFSAIDARLSSLRLTPEAILLTHAHVDHLGAIPELTRACQVPVWVHPGDRPIYSSPQNELLPWLPHVDGLPVPVDELPRPAGFDFQVIPTPGHSPGSVTYFFAAEGFAITGDTLFANAVGRTDLAGGDPAALRHSVRQVLFALPGSTLVYPGHGPHTTIGTEKQSPYLGI